MGVMHVLNRTGHQTLTWDEADVSSVENALKEYAALRSDGYVAFKKEPGRDDVERLDGFDPEASEILWLRPLQGG